MRLCYYKKDRFEKFITQNVSTFTSDDTIEFMIGEQLKLYYSKFSKESILTLNNPKEELYLKRISQRDNKRVEENNFSKYKSINYYMNDILIFSVYMERYLRDNIKYIYYGDPNYLDVYTKEFSFSPGIEFTIES